MAGLTEPHSRAEIHGKGFGGNPGQQTVKWILEHDPTQMGTMVQCLRKTSHSFKTEP